MRPLTWIPRLIAFLWGFSRRSWVDVGMGLRPRSGASALVLFLFLIFALIGLVLILLGFDLGKADRWIDAQGGWLDAAGTFLFRIACGIVLLVCALMAFGFFFNRGNPERPGFGCLLAALVIGYFAWFGFTGNF
jgi:hypothetical protein